jgi:tetratricopeptide (TPR) repeat protein
MAGTRFFWTLTATVIPMVMPVPLLAQAQGVAGQLGTESGKSNQTSKTGKEAAPQKPARRGRARTGARRDTRFATNDWNPHYVAGKAHFIAGHYDKALVELTQNVADCDRIDLDAMRRENDYFEHIWNSVPSAGQNPHAFLRASNLQWVGATLAAQGEYDLAEARFAEMEDYAGRCFPGQLSTFAGCACQGLAFLLATRGNYSEAATRYERALANIEGNQAQYGIPPAPCVAMILIALADVELARGRVSSAERFLGRAERIEEAQHQLGLGPSALDRAAFLTVFAALRQTQNRTSEAFDLYAGALELIRSVRPEHPSAAYCLDGMAAIELERGRLKLSREHFEESLRVRKASLGEKHREIAFSLEGLAKVADREGHSDQANGLRAEAATVTGREGVVEKAHSGLLAVPEKPRANNSERGSQAIERPRFLPIPAFLTVGWQVLYIGKDWRPVESRLRWRDTKEAKASGMHSVVPTKGR